MIDTCVWTGHWGSFAIPGQVHEVVDSVTEVGVTVLLLSPLDGVWAHNAHRANDIVYAAATADERVLAAPVIDPTMATWEDEIRRAVDEGARVVRWLPSYCGFELAAADDWTRVTGAASRILWVQTRLEDPRRQHPRAVVPDTVAAEVVDLARRHPQVTVVVGGATWKNLLDLAPAILGLPNCYADTSQVDGMDSLLRLVDAGLATRLLYGSHAPLFMPLAAMARVIIDVDADSAHLILNQNASQLLRLPQ
ncbi:MAG TPA: hypothetical protein DIC52_14615 [Candidatus Latescibacteria bacterium]|jgi:predicted TIM-barrel fold metal-dependent hydrolase|nr:hypothetical protein [Candidatus Latescibacterota bacterium]